MSEHTKNQWIRDGLTIYALNDQRTSNIFSAHVQGGYLTTYDQRTSAEELLANARLIAASPEMYEVLQSLQQARVYLSGVALSSSAPIWDRLNAALAKAQETDNDHS